MEHGKKRPVQHVIGERGVEIVKKCFPKEWVVREYTPDYGIDLSVELFSPCENSFITNGEHIFFQVKATTELQQRRMTVSERKNVELEYKKGKEMAGEIGVISFSLDTALLMLVEAMGSAVPVVLTVVDIEKEEVFFVCLNDYIEKVLVPEEPDYGEKKEKTIYIPVRNRLDKHEGIEIIKWYAKRPKLYALFNKINYQAKELEYCGQFEIVHRIKHFLYLLNRSDAWSARTYFPLMDYLKTEMDYYFEHGTTQGTERTLKSLVEEGVDIDEEEYEATYCVGKVSLRESTLVQELHLLWDRLASMGDVFEDVIKEYFLPTMLNVLFYD